MMNTIITSSAPYIALICAFLSYYFVVFKQTDNARVKNLSDLESGRCRAFIAGGVAWRYIGPAEHLGYVMDNFVEAKPLGEYDAKSVFVLKTAIVSLLKSEEEEGGISEFNHQIRREE